MLLCKAMRKGIFMLFIERATIFRKTKSNFQKKNLQFLQPTKSKLPTQKPIYPTARKPLSTSENQLFIHQKGFRHKNLVFSPGFSFYQSIPLVVGSASCIGFFFTAIRMALAKALKMASILWCSLSPWQKTLRLHLAASENDLKK